MHNGYIYHTMILSVEAKRKLSGRRPSWLRFLQAGLGVVAVGLAISVIVYPGIGIATVSVALAAALIVIGIERIVTGFLPNQPSPLV
jgi:uncharacterized membrane protein HdeD (DUF308 family)